MKFSEAYRLVAAQLSDARQTPVTGLSVRDESGLNGNTIPCQNEAHQHLSNTLVIGSIDDILFQCYLSFIYWI